MCNKSHFVSLFYIYWYFQILLNLFWHTDKKFVFCVEVKFWDLVRNNESSIEWFDPKKKSSTIYLGPKNLDTILMHWMSVKLADNFQIREHSWPCRFHIIWYIRTLTINFKYFHPLYRPCLLILIFTYWWIYFFSAHCKHAPCNTLTHIFLT